MASGGGTLASADLDINFLVGDTNNNKSVNASDVAQTKANSGLALSDLNFRSDTNVTGSISASDIAQVKSNAGHNVP